MLTLISQRIMKNKFGKIMDALEHNYIEYFNNFGLDLIPVSNFSENLYYCLSLPVKRIILSGGNDVGEYKQRDETERKLLDFAIAKKIPVLGICRGMQFINVYFGGGLIKNIKKEIGDEIKHVASRHLIFSKENVKVNSYHNQGVDKKTLSKKLWPFAQTRDGIIEGIYHPELPIAGIQWHPERKSPNDKINNKMIENFINEQLFWKETK